MDQKYVHMQTLLQKEERLGVAQSSKGKMQVLRIWSSVHDFKKENTEFEQLKPL